MFERFTDRARRVVVLAQEEARMLNHNYIGTEHLLLGLIHEGEGVAAVALAQLGIDLDQVRDYVEAVIGLGQQAPSGHIPFTPRAKKVLELSLREALELGHNYIGTEHILLGIVVEGQGVAADALRRTGLPLTTYRMTVLLLLFRGEYLTQQARQGRLGRVIGREREIEQLTRALQPGDGRLPLLVGDRGVGVTSLVRGFAQASLDPAAGAGLAGAEVLQIDMTHLSNAQHPFAMRIRSVASALSIFLARADVILFVRNIAAEPRIAAEAIDALSPAVASPPPRIIGSATPAQYRPGSRAGFDRLFTEITVNELPEALVAEIMGEARDSCESRHQVAIPDDVLTSALALSGNDGSGHARPGRSLDLLDRAAAVAAGRITTDVPSRHDELVAGVRARKEAAIEAQDFELAARYRSEERQLLTKGPVGVWRNMPAHRIVEVSEADVAQALRGGT